METNLNYIKAPREVFEEYGYTLPSSARQLSDGEYIAKFNRHHPIFVLMDGDKRKMFFTYEAMLSFIEWTEPSEEGDVNG